MSALVVAPSSWTLKSSSLMGFTATLPYAPVTADSAAGTQGQYPSATLVDRVLAVSYFDTTNGDLLYVRAANAQGTAWGAPVVVDATGTVGRDSSLIIVSGRPAISYYDTSGGN